MDSAQVHLQQQVQQAVESSTPLLITGGGSKGFYGRKIQGDALSTLGNSGVVEYSPTELVITVKTGTYVAEVISLLDENNQMLGFEPPLFSENATIGGMVACGLAGPSRPYSGSVNHFVLGAKVLTGKGEILGFGGQVIKNVAGFDVSRLMVGALGCLGVLLEVSFKVIPKPIVQETIKVRHPDAQEAIEYMNQLCTKPVPVSAACWYQGETHIRLSGSQAGVDAAAENIQGEKLSHGAEFWLSVKEQTHPFFKQNGLLLRASVAPATSSFADQWSQFIDWGGGIRWFNQETENATLLDTISKSGGHYCNFNNTCADTEVFSALPPAIMKLHQNLKNSFDPSRILNPGRMYSEL